jgi:L,D-peptidoglycan transpeptidase YkuD (ErfK/YbiS/YcfS/YnhG family)
VKHCRLRATLLFLMSLFASAGAGSATDVAWSDSRQLVLVVTPGWDDNQGTLATFELQADAWEPVRGPVPVAIGRSGSAWGIGLHPAQSGARKREGDGRSPAGVFRVGEAFGYAPSLATALHYAAMRESDYCVDVSGSPYYNRIVDARVVGEGAVAGSTEPMRRDLHANGDQRYKLGFVIEHNPAGGSQGGSCIFAHLWRAPGEPTSGCTAMTEPVMRELLAWLRDDQHPVFVLLPQAEYLRLKTSWHLPDLAVESH